MLGSAAVDPAILGSVKLDPTILDPALFGLEIFCSASPAVVSTCSPATMAVGADAKSRVKLYVIAAVIITVASSHTQR
jgi:hypothetical protein